WKFSVITAIREIYYSIKPKIILVSIPILILINLLIRNIRNSNYDPSDIPDSSLPILREFSE
ncbi:MAG: hypothetical protein WBN72_01595, partial [Nitrososphaeraceae archaeon]